jgi:Mrp family chromosome partitioning ATPase
MDQIRQALDRAKQTGPGVLVSQERPAAQVHRIQVAGLPLAPQATLNTAHLEANRVIAHDIEDPRSRAFDMLRTQILQPMDMKSWHLLGVTSPTPGCGKTVVSINLALSIARQPDRQVLLVDMDLQRPKVADYLGMRVEEGIISVLEGRSTLANAIVPTQIRNHQLLVLPCEGSTLRSSEWMASRQMTALIQDIKRTFPGWTVILDFPPILAGDDFITILPQIDSVLFVVGAGLSTKSEIKDCNKHLDTASVIRVVVNRALDSATNHYYARY